MRRAKTLTVLAAVAAIAAALATTTSASDSVSPGLVQVGDPRPIATTSDETLVRYLPSDRKPVKRKIAFLSQCSLDCKLFVRMTLVLPGPNIGPENVTGSFDAETIVQGFISLDGAGLQRLKDNRRAARFRTRVRAVDVVTGEVDIDRRTFRFKRG